MRYSINDISRLITEDPDVFVESSLYGIDDILCEASPEKYLNYFNKSTVKTGRNWRGPEDVRGHLPDPIPPPTQDQINTNPRIFYNDSTSTLKDLTADQKIALIERIQAVVDPTLGKFEQYFIRQVASGNLRLERIEEDSVRLNEIIAKFIKHSRKAYWKSAGLPTSILDFPDWTELEQKIHEIEAANIEYDDADKEILFSKAYVNNVMSLLLGEPPEIVKYWFRNINSFDEAKKYGCGTSWCTAVSKNYFSQYHGNAGLYIIEMQTSTIGRRPVFQISGTERMDRDDVAVSKFGPRLGDFAREVIEKYAPDPVTRDGSKITQITIDNLKELIVSED